jgi:hypothetical protein
VKWYTSHQLKIADLRYGVDVTLVKWMIERVWHVLQYKAIILRPHMNGHIMIDYSLRLPLLYASHEGTYKCEVTADGEQLSGVFRIDRAQGGIRVESVNEKPMDTESKGLDSERSGLSSSRVSVINPEKNMSNQGPGITRETPDGAGKLSIEFGFDQYSIFSRLCFASDRGGCRKPE